MRIAFDTNILIYSEGGDDAGKQAAADALLVAIRDHDLVLPLQAAAEMYRYLRRKKKLSRDAARSALEEWQRLLPIKAATTSSTFDAALDIATRHHLQIFDAIILAASSDAGCRMLLSEDMQDGFVWRSVTVVNPFLPVIHPLLRDLLGG